MMSLDSASAPQRVPCPCCHYPTLESRGSFELCRICWWEDDGQDDPHADEIWGGPNQDYSLTEARANFLKYGTMYAPDRDKRLIRDIPREHELVASLIEVFEGLKSESESSARDLLWKKALDIEARIDGAVDDAIENWEKTLPPEPE